MNSVGRYSYIREGLPHFFLNRALFRLNPALNIRTLCTVASPGSGVKGRGNIAYMKFFVAHKITRNENVSPMPNVMVAVPNIGGALCLTPQFG